MHAIFPKLLLSVILVLSSGAWSPLCAAPQPADDDDAVVPEGPLDESAKPKGQPAPPAENNELRKTDESDLAHQMADEIDRLERVIGGMRSAQKRIAGSDTSPETQKVQERV